MFFSKGLFVVATAFTAAVSGETPLKYDSCGQETTRFMTEGTVEDISKINQWIFDGCVGPSPFQIQEAPDYPFLHEPSWPQKALSFFGLYEPLTIKAYPMKDLSRTEAQRFLEDHPEIGILPGGDPFVMPSEEQDSASSSDSPPRQTKTKKAETHKDLNCNGGLMFKVPFKRTDLKRMKKAAKNIRKWVDSGCVGKSPYELLDHPEIPHKVYDTSGAITIFKTPTYIPGVHDTDEYVEQILEKAHAEQPASLAKARRLGIDTSPETLIHSHTNGKPFIFLQDIEPALRSSLDFPVSVHSVKAETVVF